MSNLKEYLVEKRAALLALNSIPTDEIEPKTLKVRASAEGRSGIRHIRIRDHHIISDSPTDFAGYDLGPASPEIFLGSLSSCLTHIFLIHAADRQIPLSKLEVEVTADIDARGGKRAGYEHIPFYPHNIRYQVELESNVSEEEILALQEAVERWCPVLNLIKNPQPLSGTVVYKRTED